MSMKLSSKPISSPGRTEKFPPPLMRFLRSNPGSRSRGRCRSSPMFTRKKNAVIETQEPSSPKVTCIGQVRVRRSSKNSGNSKSHRTDRSRNPGKNRTCWWVFVRRALFCKPKKVKPKSFRSIWRRWVLFCRFGYCRKVDISEDSSKVQSNRREGGQHNASDTDDGVADGNEREVEIEQTNEGFKLREPPKNALLLTRCRSAPYRSSSLASRFWGSPVVEDVAGETRLSRPAATDGEMGCSESTNDEENAEIGNECGRSSIDSRTVGNSKEENVQELRVIEEGGGSARPLILTRCKSEPARTGERLQPEALLWLQQQTRLGIPEPPPPPSSSSESNCD